MHCDCSVPEFEFLEDHRMHDILTLFLFWVDRSALGPALKCILRAFQDPMKVYFSLEPLTFLALHISRSNENERGAGNSCEVGGKYSVMISKSVIQI